MKKVLTMFTLFFACTMAKAQIRIDSVILHQTEYPDGPKSPIIKYSTYHPNTDSLAIVMSRAEAKRYWPQKHPLPILFADVYTDGKKHNLVLWTNYWLVDYTTKRSYIFKSTADLAYLSEIIRRFKASFIEN